MAHLRDKLMTPAPKTLTLQDDRFILEKFIHLQVAGLPAVSVWTKHCGLEQKSWGEANVDLFKPGFKQF